MNLNEEDEMIGCILRGCSDESSLAMLSASVITFI